MNPYAFTADAEGQDCGVLVGLQVWTKVLTELTFAPKPGGGTADAARVNAPFASVTVRLVEQEEKLGPNAQFDPELVAAGVPASSMKTVDCVPPEFIVAPVS